MGLLLEHCERAEVCLIKFNYKYYLFIFGSYAMAEAFAQIGKPTDVNEWQMTAQTVNAYYDPTHNQMVRLIHESGPVSYIQSGFPRWYPPAAILQSLVPPGDERGWYRHDYGPRTNAWSELRSSRARLSLKFLIF